MRVALLCLAGVVAGCSGGVSGSSSSSSSSSGASGSSSSSSSSSSSGSGPVCTTPTTVPCADALISDLLLKTVLNTGAITNTEAAGVWTSEVDATAGGFGAPNPPSFLYAKFTDTGLTRVDIHDQQALESMDWDIAFRRYIVRINSEDSGPSCVQAMRMPDADTFESVTSPSTTLQWRTDDVETASCAFISDSSGLDGSPASALSSYWTYPGCVKMTGHVFVLRQATGRMLKLVVEKYYSDVVQAECQAAGMTTTMPTGSGNFRIKWAFLG